MVVVAQLVRAPDCGSGGRRFETALPPKIKPSRNWGFFLFGNIIKNLFKYKKDGNFTVPVNIYVNNFLDS